MIKQTAFYFLADVCVYNYVILAIPLPRLYRNCTCPRTRAKDIKSPCPFFICPLYRSNPLRTRLKKTISKVNALLTPSSLGNWRKLDPLNSGMEISVCTAVENPKINSIFCCIQLNLVTMFTCISGLSLTRGTFTNGFAINRFARCSVHTMF